MKLGQIWLEFTTTSSLGTWKKLGNKKKNKAQESWLSFSSSVLIKEVESPLNLISARHSGDWEN